MQKHNCEQCSFRKKYDNKPTSLIGNLWRWHINFCPGRKAYMSSLDEDMKKELISKYKIVIK